MLICDDCEYFIQHYSFQNGIASKVFCGHCSKRGSRYKFSSLRKECQFYEQKKIDNNAEMYTKILKTLDYLQSQIYDLKKDLQKDL